MEGSRISEHAIGVEVELLQAFPAPVSFRIRSHDSLRPPSIKIVIALLQ